MRLFKELSPADAVVVGLLGPDPCRIPWFREALHVAIAKNQNEAIINAVGERHLVVPLLHALRKFQMVDLFPKLEIDQLEIEELKSGLYRAAAEHVAYKVSNVCKELTIPNVFLKGIVTGDLYESSEQRAVADVDVLVPRSLSSALFLALQDDVGTLAHYDPQSDTLQKLDKVVDTANSYELPALWTEVSIEVEEPVFLRLANAGRMRRFRLGEQGQVFARVPIEIHFELFSHVFIDAFADQDGRAASGLRKLENNLELIYTLFKAYTDITILRKPKGCKLLMDVFRMLEARGQQLDANIVLHLCEKVGLSRALQAITSHAQHIYDIPPFIDHFHSLHFGQLDMGDVLPNVFTSRWTPFDFSIA